MSFCTSLCGNEKRENMDLTENNVEVKVSCVQQCMFTWSAAASNPSRRFCSVTAVVCRQRGHMTWGSLPPSSRCLLFLGKMAAKALLLPMTYMNWCEQKKTWEIWWCIVLQWNRPQLLKHILHTEGTVNVSSLTALLNLNLFCLVN